ncbi:HGGxSTG domain-containing protein [Hyphomonas sp.]|uniref:HGGxSTG domain-containing protein n=1 Tax=Hyphomonas sp. TaxID=87 RepID=UPI003F71E89C
MADNRACGAKTRQGHPCPSWSMPNGRCRMHGGTSPGAPKGNRNAWKHGKYSAWTKALIAFEKAAHLK